MEGLDVLESFELSLFNKLLAPPSITFNISCPPHVTCLCSSSFWLVQWVRVMLSEGGAELGLGVWCV